MTPVQVISSEVVPPQLAGFLPQQEWKCFVETVHSRMPVQVESNNLLRLFLCIFFVVFVLSVSTAFVDSLRFVVVVLVWLLSVTFISLILHHGCRSRRYVKGILEEFQGPMAVRGISLRCSLPEDRRRDVSVCSVDVFILEVITAEQSAIPGKSLDLADAPKIPTAPSDMQLA